MKLPYINNIPEGQNRVDVFGGYNHRLRIGEGEFYDMENLTSSSYPLIAPRAARGLYKSLSKPGGIIAKEKLCYVDGANFVIGDDVINMGLTEGEKQLVSMGAYVIIIPDKKYINTQDYEDRGEIEKSFTTPAKVAFSIYDINGTPVSPIVATDKYERVAKNSYWINTSTTQYTINEYSSNVNGWREYTTGCVCIACKGIGSAFSVGDSIYTDGFNSTFYCTDEVTITNDTLASLPDKEKYSTVLAVHKDTENDGAGDHILVSGYLGEVIQLIGYASKIYWEGIDSGTIVSGTKMPTSLLQYKSMTFSCRMPHMDYIVESGNRLWGCRYGTALNDEFVNEIYASKLGDFKNWNSFQGIDSDSWAASVGSDGPFTGAVSYGGHPIFFKENIMHRVYGDYPSQFGYTDVVCRGVAPGSDKSLAVVNEVLYYHSRHGICAYDGALPTSVSDAFGERRYSDAVGGAFDDRYYVSMCDTSGNYRMFVYDSLRGLWYREDNTQAVGFASFGGELYYIDALDKGIKTVNGTGEALEKLVPWSFTTGMLFCESHEKKFITRLNIRMSVSLGTEVRFYIEYDSSGFFEPVGVVMRAQTGSFNLPIRARRCDHMRLRAEGKGEFKIFSITKTYAMGGDGQ